MKRTTMIIMISTSILLIIMSLISFAFPYFKSPTEGELEVYWSFPKGLKLNDMTKGDTSDLTFSSNIEVSIYLLKKEQAENFRNPSFYKEPLPQPLITGYNGSVKITIEEDGDYEILFWNSSLSTSITVHYSIYTESQKEQRISIISGSSLIFLSLVPVLIIMIDRYRKRQTE